MSLQTKIAALRALSPNERRMVVEAVVFLAIARLLIVLAPMRRLRHILTLEPKDAWAAPEASLPEDVRRAVTRAARHVPWNAVCLPQAMAAKFMLARRGRLSTLHLGAARSPSGDLQAHAWLVCDDAIVVGEAGAQGMTAVARF
jgi:hypothetical protein